MIDTMFQEGTEKVGNDILARPLAFKPDAPKFTWGGLVKAPGQGIGAGAAESIAYGAEITGAFGQVMAATDARPGGMFSVPDKNLSDLVVGTEEERARRKMITTGVDFSNEAGDLFRARAAEIMPDPQSTHSSSQVVAGVAKFATKAVGYALTTGPVAPINVGVDEGLTEADKLKQQGVDLATRTKAGTVAGVVAGGSVALPVAGSTLAGTAGLVAVGGPGGFMAQQQATKKILENAGYKEIANQYDPLDPVGLALSTLVPAAFGGFALRGKLKTEADMKKAAQLTPAEQARSDAFERSPANLAELEAAIKAEKNPANKALLEAELVKQREASVNESVRSAVKADPEVIAAARVDQVAEAIDGMRLTRSDDLAGMTAHTDALARAHDQMAAGERVEVEGLIRAAAEEKVTFTTAKGSTYVVEGQTTIRDKAARSDVGHEGDFGPQPASERTFYVDEAGALALSEFQTQGGKKALVIAGDQAAVRYDEGPNAGKLERRTLTNIHSEPGVGLTPVEVWSGGTKVHFGNKITEIRREPAGRSVEAAKALDKIRSVMRPPEPPGAAKTDVTALEATAKPVAAKATEGESAGATAVSRAATEAAALKPDMVVQMEGMEPMRAADLLKKIKEEAKEDAEQGDFVQAAVACLLRS